MSNGIRQAMGVSALPTTPGQPRLLRLELTVSEGGRLARFSTLRLVSPAKASSQ